MPNGGLRMAATFGHMGPSYDWGKIKKIPDIQSRRAGKPERKESGYLCPTCENSRVTVCGDECKPCYNAEFLAENPRIREFAFENVWDGVE